MKRARDAALALETLAVSVRARRALAHRGLPGALRTFHLTPVDHAAAALPAGAWTPGLRHVARVAGVLLDLRPVRSTCLPTAVAMAEILHRHGATADVVIGVSSADGFSAHAWVELAEGRIDLAGHPLSAHGEMARFRHRAERGAP